MSTKRSNPARFFAFIFLSTVCCTPIAAQSSPDDPAIAKQVQISRQGDLVSIDMELDVNHIKIGKNEVHIITPLLQSNIDQNMNAPFSPVIISGTIRNKVVKREISLNTENNLGKLNPVAIIKKERRGSQIFLYQDAIPFEPWMEDASLVLNSENRGCAGCDMGNEATTLLARIFPEEFIPVWQLTYIEPEPEPVDPMDQYQITAKSGSNIDIQGTALNLSKAMKAQELLAGLNIPEGCNAFIIDKEGDIIDNTDTVLTDYKLVLMLGEDVLVRNYTIKVSGEETGTTTPTNNTETDPVPTGVASGSASILVLSIACIAAIIGKRKKTA